MLRFTVDEYVVCFTWFFFNVFCVCPSLLRDVGESVRPPLQEHPTLMFWVTHRHTLNLTRASIITHRVLSSLVPCPITHVHVFVKPGIPTRAACR